MDPRQEAPRYVVGTTHDRHRVESELAPVATVIEAFPAGDDGEVVIVEVPVARVAEIAERFGPNAEVVDGEEAAFALAQQATARRPHSP